MHLKFQTDPDDQSVLLAIDFTSTVPLSRAITLPPAVGHASVEVVAVTPLAGVNLAPDQLAAPSRPPSPRTSKTAALWLYRSS